MKITFFGVCVSPVLASIFKEMMPDADILGFEAAPVLHSETIETARSRLAESDLVFCQDNMPPALADFSFSKQRDKRGDVTRIPSIGFTGYHPDCIYLVHEAKHYSSPIGPYNSAIVASAFSRGSTFPKRWDCSMNRHSQNSDISMNSRSRKHFSKMSSRGAG